MKEQIFLSFQDEDRIWDGPGAKEEIQYAPRRSAGNKLPSNCSQTGEVSLRFLRSDRQTGLAPSQHLPLSNLIYDTFVA
jgi:hypothetical protein